MKLRKALVFLLCIVLTLPLIACNKNTRPDSSTEQPNGGGQTCKVTFDVGADAKAAGATVSPASKNVNKGKAIGTLPVPTGYNGYTFVKWVQPGGAQLMTTTVINSEMTVTAEWKSNAAMNAEAQAYESTLSSWSQAGHLYIHYKRYDHMESEQGTVTNTGAPGYSNAIESQVYKDWGLWMWPKGGDGRLFNAMKIDVSGAVYDAKIDEVYHDAGWDGTHKVPLNSDTTYSEVESVGIQLFQISTRTGTGFWANDGGNNYLTLADIKRADGSYHWFVNQGRVGSGSATYAAATYSDPYADIPEGSATTKRTVGDGIINSSSNNSATYPTWGAKAAGYENDGVGYQIFIASFRDGIQDDANTPKGKGMGDLRGIIDALDEGYFDDLNVDVLWLTPFQSSTNYHGYDIIDYYSVDSRFGTLDDYRELVYKVHQKGMKIVMDFVLNHTSQANPWYVKSQNLEKEIRDDGTEIDYRNFYTWINKEEYDALHDCTDESKEADGHSCAKDQWFGDAYGYYFYSSFSSDLPELNYDYQPVRDAILDVCNYWMAFGLDGFRLDAVKHIYMKNELYGKTPSSGNRDNGEGTIEDGLYSYDLTRNLNFYREFNYRLKTNYPNAFLVGENLDGNPRNTTNYYQGIDSQFNFNLYYDASRAFARTQQAGESSGRANNALIKWEEGYYGNSYYDKNSNENVNVKGYATVNPNFIDGLFTSNHDLPRARDRMNITTNNDGSVDTYHAITTDADITKTDKLLRMYYTYVMTMPGLNWIYYGDELGMTGVMDYTLSSGSTSSTDSQPHEDRVYRQPMKWFTDLNKNASYEIGYSNFKAELTGLNATNSVEGVDDQDTDPNSMLNWMRTLTKIRHENTVLINGTIPKAQNYSEGSTLMYTVSKGSSKINVYMNFGEYDFYKSRMSGEVIASTPYGWDGNKLAANSYGIVITKG